ADDGALQDALRHDLLSLSLLGRGLLGRNGLDARDVTAHLAHARGLLELARRLLEAQVELLLLQGGELVAQLVGRLCPDVGGFHPGRPFLFTDALHEARLHRELGRAETKRLARRRLVDAVDLEHDAAGLDARRPVFDRALALAMRTSVGLPVTGTSGKT